jgi:hypothetical protein
LRFNTKEGHDVLMEQVRFNTNDRECGVSLEQLRFNKRDETQVE